MKNEKPIPESQWVRALVDAHAADLNRYAASILRDTDAAKDVVQDAFPPKSTLKSKPPSRPRLNYRRWSPRSARRATCCLPNWPTNPSRL